jgi:hypothetical protein
MTGKKNISKSTLKKSYSVFISSFSPQKTNNVWKMWVSLSLYIKWVSRKKKQKKEKKTGSPFTTKISHYTCVCNTKIPWLILLSWHHCLTDMIGIMWCASCSGDCWCHTYDACVAGCVVVYSDAKKCGLLKRSNRQFIFIFYFSGYSALSRIWRTQMIWWNIDTRSVLGKKGDSHKLKDLHTNNDKCPNLELWEGRSLERGILTYPSFAHKK